MTEVLLLNCELVSRVKLCLVNVFPDIVKDFPKIRNLPKIFLRSFENVAPEVHDIYFFFGDKIPYKFPNNNFRSVVLQTVIRYDMIQESNVDSKAEYTA